MSQPISIRFHAELNDFLPQHQRHKNVYHEIKKTRSVKDLIESLGVPHTEIDLIIVDDVSVDFTCQINGGEHIRVYPCASSVAISPLRHNRPEPLREHRFVIDVHLGRLASYLRMLNFDSLYRNDYDDPELAHISAIEQRILLTCDLKLLMRRQVLYGYFVRSREPRQQVLEVLTHFNLFDDHPTDTRCMRCNGIIRRVCKQQITGQLKPLTRLHYSDFFQCDGCEKIYWEGSHYTKMQSTIKNIRTRQ